ncbi:MAG TPA: branched-chain amino acid aminotransferase, partial [Anaerolineae bacterium]|nr:branched-chain amino acid aminotransferase [Anaerolineae bacterium]
MAGQTPLYIWMNGEFIPWDEAKLHVSTAAVQTGSRIFEGLRGYWNDEEEQLYIFKIDEHLRRLAQSMKMMRMNLDFS